jgi:hypothetical protein
LGDEAVFVGIGGVEEGVQLVLADGGEHLVQQIPQLPSLDEAAPWSGKHKCTTLISEEGAGEWFSCTNPPCQRQ